MLTLAIGVAILSNASRNPCGFENPKEATRRRKATTNMARRAAKKSAGKKVGRGKATKKKASGDLIISKSRTKATASINVSGDFYSALDGAVRRLIANAEARATNNGRRTLRPHDL